MGGCFGIDTRSSSISEEAGLLGVQNRRILTLERDPTGSLDEQNKPKLVIVADSTPTKEQRIAARLFSSETARLFRQKTESDNLSAFTNGSDFDLKITSSPMWPSAKGLTSDSLPIRVIGDNSSSSDALNLEGSVVKRISNLWSSGKSSIRFTARTSFGNPIEGRFFGDGDDSTLSGHLLQRISSNLDNPASGLTGNESYNFTNARDDSSSVELFLNAESSSDVLQIHQEKEESPQCVPNTYNNGQESSSDQLCEDNFMVNETRAPNIRSSFTGVHPPHQDNYELTSLSPSQQDASLIICRERSLSPGIYSPVAPPIVQEVASPPSMGIKMIANSTRSDSSEIIRFNDVTSTLIPRSVNSVDVDEKSLIITSFDGHKAQTKERPARRGLAIDDELSLTDRIVEMALNNQQPTVPVFHDGDSSTDPIDFGEDQIQDKQTNRTEELSVSDRIVFEIKETELNRPFVNEESSSDPLDFEGSLDSHMGEPFGPGSGINKRNKKNNVKDRREQKQSNLNIPEFTAESSSEILFRGDTKYSAIL